jgi:cell division protein FtsI (penicillin-binding protein 3)
MIIGYAARRNSIKLVGERSTALDLARGRLVLVSAMFVLAFMLLAARAVDLTVIQGALNPVTQEFSAEEMPLPVAPVATRADIRDRNGVLLATTLKTASLFADTKLISDPQETAQGLVKIFPDLSFGDVLQKLQSGKRFVWIRRSIMPAEQYAILELGQPGLEFRYEDRRVYPQGRLLSHFVGYTSIDNDGQAGIERSFDRLLAGGRDLTLTMDVRLQHALRREIKTAMKDFSAIGGMGVIMDVRTGEILASVSLPDFDPHNPGSAKKDATFNRVTLGVYEPGSVFKIFSTAALLETKGVPLSTTFDASEPIKRGRFTINDYHAEDRVLTVPEVFMYSSNIGAAMMGEAVGTENLKNFYADLGLTSKLEFEISEIGTPQVPEPWRDINTLTASYGHGIATTPLQLTAAVSSIMNGGLLVKPRLVLQEEGAKMPEENPEIRVVSPQTAHRMRQLMRLVVTDGTATKADVPGFRVGGKTGTAEKIKAGGGYDHGRLMSSFIGVFPVDDPQYAVYIALDEPKGTKASYGYATGGWTAAPAVARVIASMATILGLQPKPLSAEQELGASLKIYISAKGHD